MSSRKYAIISPVKHKPFQLSRGTVISASWHIFSKWSFWPRTLPGEIRRLPLELERLMQKNRLEDAILRVFGIAQYRINKKIVAVDSSGGYNQEELDALCEIRSQLDEFIRSMKATTVKGLRVKARMVRRFYSRNDFWDEQEETSLSLARDILLLPPKCRKPDPRKRVAADP